MKVDNLHVSVHWQMVIVFIEEVTIRCPVTCRSPAHPRTRAHPQAGGALRRRLDRPVRDVRTGGDYRRPLHVGTEQLLPARSVSVAGSVAFIPRRARSYLPFSTRAGCLNTRVARYYRYTGVPQYLGIPVQYCSIYEY